MLYDIIFVDEVSTLSPRLLGVLDSFLRRACKRHQYAKNGRHERIFGGMNIIFAGDFWQLPPVRANSIFTNIFRSGFSFEEQTILKMFWKKNDRNSIQELHVLDKPMRTDDPWLIDVLNADRIGAEDWELYCFIHGLPTRNTGS